MAPRVYIGTLLVVVSLAFPSISAADELLGTYNLNYRYNAAGCNNSAGPPTAGNPYYCNYIAPGPYFINAPPGEYRVEVVEASGGGGAAVFSGDSSGGTKFIAPVTFYHSSGQIVLYWHDWYPWDNSDTIYEILALYRITADPLKISTGQLPNGVVGATYADTTMQAQGGTMPYAWKAVGLPPGMSLSSAGVLSGTPASAGAFNVTITVTDNASPAQTDSVTLPLTVVAPLRISTLAFANGVVGQSYTGATLHAQGGAPPYIWSATGLPAGMRLGSSGALSGTPAGPGSFDVTVTVRDSSTPQETDSRVLILRVVSALTITTSALPGGAVGRPYPGTTLQAQGGSTPYAWSATGLPPGLGLSSAGMVSGTPASAGSFSITVTVKDGSSPRQTDSTTLPLTVTSGPTIVPVALPGGVVGHAYPGATLQAQGGTAPYSWSATGLPPGLSLTSAGVLSGTPASAGSFNITVTVTDDSSPRQTDSTTLPLTVTPGLTIIAVALPGGAIGQAYPGATLQAQGGTAPYAWSATGLPPGLSLTSAGVLSGTPASAGSFSMTVTVTDGSSPRQTDSTTLPLTVTSGLTIIAAALPGGVVGQAYPGATLQAQGGTAPYAWSATGLPPGLSLSSAGVLSGTPASAGSFSVTVTVTDGSSPRQTDSTTLPLTVTSGLTIIAVALPGGVVGQAYPGATLQAQGGTAPYSWSATGLPPGLSLSSAGVVSGIPMDPGTFNVTVRVTDSAQQNASRTYSFTIDPPAPPSLTVSVDTPPVTISDQPDLTLNLSQPYPLPLDAQLTLSFVPDAAGVPAGDYASPALQFESGGRTATVTVPADNSSWRLPSVQVGDVAGTITVTVTSVEIAGTGVAIPLPGSPPLASIEVPRLAPIIAGGSVRVTDVTASGFTVQMVSASTPRDLSSATFNFTPASGVQLNGTSFTVPLTDVAKDWFESTPGQAAGGSFALKVSFPFSGGDPRAFIGSVSVTLTNSVGMSISVSGTL